MLVVVAIGLLLLWRGGWGGNEAARKKGESTTSPLGKKAGDGVKGPKTRTERRGEGGDEPEVGALLSDTSLSDPEAGLRFLELAQRQEKENKSGVVALEHAAHLMDDAGYQKLIEWFEVAPPERRLAQVALLDAASRKLSNQCRLRLALLKSPDPTVREEVYDDLRFLLDLEEGATETDIRFAVGRVIGKEEGDNQEQKQ